MENGKDAWQTHCDLLLERSVADDRRRAWEMCCFDRKPCRVSDLPTDDRRVFFSMLAEVISDRRRAERDPRATGLESRKRAPELIAAEDRTLRVGEGWCQTILDGLRGGR